MTLASRAFNNLAESQGVERRVSVVPPAVSLSSVVVGAVGALGGGNVERRRESTAFGPGFGGSLGPSPAAAKRMSKVGAPLKLDIGAKLKSKAAAAKENVRKKRAAIVNAAHHQLKRR